MVTAETDMEARIARLESDVTHIRSDVADLKSDLRDLRTIDMRDLRKTVESTKDSIASAKIWALILYVALAGAMFGTLARGFGWI